MIKTDFNSKMELYKRMERLSTRFRIELPFQEVLYYFEAIGGYNDFTPADQVDMLLRIDEMIPRQHWNANNPNNGHRAYTVSVGTEGSMVLYLNFTALQNLGNGSQIISQVRAVEHQIEQIAYNIGKADEFSMDYTDKGYCESLQIRIWWD